jgi:hypothetical protein
MPDSVEVPGSKPQLVAEVGGSRPPRRVVLGRRRRANTPGGRQYAHQVKVTAEEEAVLVRLASEAGVSVPRLLVESAVAEDRMTATARREMLVQLFDLSRVLGGVANNLNQLARHANATGEFPAGAFAVRERVRQLLPRVESTLSVVSGVSIPPELRELPPRR